jgi:hypothetical protein
MGIKAYLWPVRAELAAALTAILVAGCDQQDPAFSESRAERTVQSEDANGVRSLGDGGVESLDPSALPDGGAADAGAGDGAGDGGVGTAGNDGGSDGADSGADSGTDAGAVDSGAETDGSADAGLADGGAADAGADGGVGVDGGADGMDAGGTDQGADGGLGLNMRTVELTQQGPGKVDILWVVDTSGSMAEEQQYLANNFNAMITALNDAGHDFQTAVTTTDVCQDTLPADLAQRVCPADYGGSPATHLRGAFRGDAGRKVLKRGDADLVQKFNAYTSAGVDASGFEHGLKGAQLAIAKSLSGENEPLVRSNAFLAVIVVSDEQDDGIGLWQTDYYTGYNFHDLGLTTFKFTEDDMVSYLQSVKGAGHFSISAITGTRLANGTMCSAPHSQPQEEGTQYIKAAQKSGGIIQSICDTNWNQSLTTLGLDLNAQITQVALPSAPNVPTIKVYVNGVANTAWTYNAGNNEVKFNVGHVPAEGAAIKVTYYEMR